MFKVAVNVYTVILKFWLMTTLVNTWDLVLELSSLCRLNSF